MKCKDFEKNLDSFVDHECSPEKASAMRGHLQLCESCLAKAEDLKFWKKSAFELPEVEPPESLFQSIKNELKEHEVKDSKRPGWWYAWLELKPWVPVLGVTCLLVLVGGLYWGKASFKDGRVAESGATPPVKTNNALGLVKSDSWQNTWSKDIQETEREFLGAIEMLEKDLDSQQITWRQKDNAEAWQEKLLVAKKELEADNQNHGSLDQEDVFSLYQERIDGLQETLFASW